MVYKVEKQIREIAAYGVKPYEQVHAHSTANPGSTAQNEADYMARKDLNSGYYTHVVGNGRVIQTAHVDRGAWDVGNKYNFETYAAVELIESHKTKEEFMKDYAIYCELLRDLAKAAGVPTTVDSGANAGIKTHKWCTDAAGTYGGHVDPYPYLAKWGISKEQFAKDVQTLVGGGGTTTTTPAQPTQPAKPTTPSKGTKINQGIYTVDSIEKVFGIWQVRCNFLVPVEFEWKDNGIDVRDIVLVEKDGYILGDQTTKQGSRFVFDTNKIISVGTPVKGSGGYNWAPVTLKNSGTIWLSVKDKNDLINKVSND